MRVAGDLQEVVGALRGAFGTGSLPGPDSYSKGVLADLAKFGISSGMQPYDLAEYAVFLQPVFSPLRCGPVAQRKNRAISVNLSCRQHRANLALPEAA